MKLTEEEEKQILESPPKGTWAMLLVYGILFTAAWLYMWFGVFVAHGPVN